MLLSPVKGETAVHGYHWPGDMVVGMRKVLAIPRSWYVCFSAEFSADKYSNISKVTPALQAIYFIFYLFFFILFIPPIPS